MFNNSSLSNNSSNNNNNSKTKTNHKNKNNNSNKTTTTTTTTATATATTTATTTATATTTTTTATATATATTTTTKTKTKTKPLPISTRLAASIAPMLHHQGRWQEDYRNSIRKKVQGPAETQSTLPRTKSKWPWKWMVGRWIFLLWRPIFRGYVTLVRVHCLPLYSWTLGSSQKTGLQWIMKAKSRSLSKNSEWYAYFPTVVKVSLMRVPLKLVNYTIIFCPSR